MDNHDLYLVDQLSIKSTLKKCLEELGCAVMIPHQKVIINKCIQFKKKCKHLSKTVVNRKQMKGKSLIILAISLY